MRCHCTYGYEDGDEYSVVWREARITKTRKPHKCFECSAVIPEGTRCCTATWLQNGSWTTAYRCLNCTALAEIVAEANKACPLWGGLSESADYAGINFWDWHKNANVIAPA